MGILVKRKSKGGRINSGPISWVKTLTKKRGGRVLTKQKS